LVRPADEQQVPAVRRPRQDRPRIVLRDVLDIDAQNLRGQPGAEASPAVAGLRRSCA
jgi:hypothetical protein